MVALMLTLPLGAGLLGWALFDVISQHVMRKVVHKIGLLEPTWTLQSRWSLRKAWFIVRNGTLTAWFADAMNISGYMVPSCNTAHTFDEMVIEISWTSRPYMRTSIRHCEITLVTQPKAEWGGGKQLLVDWVAGYQSWVLDWLTSHLDVCCGLPRAAVKWHEDLGSPMRRLVVEIIGHMEPNLKPNPILNLDPTRRALVRTPVPGRRNPILVDLNLYAFRSPPYI
ncbi:hypothetical protein T492DRAFT_838672 [Pavlovales sp. CCMP2436]|nr:hypothetical protein T492DRAFT_838672 [Pavlovales sp. CCMP2436]